MIKRGIIYKVTSPSGKIYIGQTTKTLGQRRYKHFEYVNRHPDLMTKWACALRKYGNRLIWEVVKDNVPVQDLDKEEIAAIIEYDSFESGYNGTLGGGGSNGRKLSDKTKSIIAEKATGRKASRATRTKMSKSRKGRKMPKSDQHCINISKSKSTGGYKNENNSNAKLTWNIVKKIRKMYKKHSVRYLSQHFGLSKSTVYDVISNKRWFDKSYVYIRRGNGGSKGKLTKSQVIKIRGSFRCGISIMSLADKYDVSRGTISNIVHRRTWREINE